MEDYNAQVGEALELLKEGLLPLIRQVASEHPSIDWKQKARSERGEQRRPVRRDEKQKELDSDVGKLALDLSGLFRILLDKHLWNSIFGEIFHHDDDRRKEVYHLISTARLARNRWGHKSDQNVFSFQDSEQVLGAIILLLQAVASARTTKDVQTVASEKAVLVQQKRIHSQQEQQKKNEESIDFNLSAVPSSPNKTVDEAKLSSESTPLQKNMVQEQQSLTKIKDNSDNKKSTAERSNHQINTSAPRKTSKLIKPVAMIFAFLGVVLLGGAALGHRLWNGRPCEVSTENRVQGVCYKDLTRTPLVVGILTSPDDYEDLKNYLKERLKSEALDVIVEGNSEITYQEAQNNIAQKNWDVIFSFSPMNGLRAKDNGYEWVARMFPDYPATYQSALFVRADSPIQAISDIDILSTVALGDFSSASSFYMPVYDLYGKAMNVTAGHRGQEIIDLVASGQVNVGAAVYGRVQDDPQFRVIHVSREIPGSGVYLSPKLSSVDEEKIRQLIIGASEAIKAQANYGSGEEPNYENFRAISLKVDEALACADFSQNPVQFFCDQTNRGTTGKINGFTYEADGVVRLRLDQDDSNICYILVSLQTLSTIPNGNSPGVLNRKRVSIFGVEPELKNETCELTIINAEQLKVIQQ